MKKFEIFIIGPMGEDKDNPEEESTPISKHVGNIKLALQSIKEDIAPRGEVIDIYAPTDGMSDVESYVFNRIDSADLAVADITARSPSVMYELSFFHALGTPIIIIDDKERGERDTPFYLRGANILRVDNFEVDSLAPALEKRLRAFFNSDNDQRFSENPIRKFYSAPLVEAAGASAVARGYYWNLIDPVINAGFGVIASHPDENLAKLKIVKPSESFVVNEDLKKYGDIAARWNNGEKLFEHEWNINYAGRSRGVKAYKIGNNIYDYPRAIGALERSPRLRRVTGRKTPGESTRISAERLTAARERVSSQLVKYFMAVLEDEIGDNAKQVFEDRVEFISLDDFAREVSTLPVKPSNTAGRSFVQRFLKWIRGADV